MAPLCTCNSPLNVIFLHLNFSFRASSNYSKHYFILAGVDFSPEENFHVIPNAEIVVYDQSGVDTDIVPRVTFSYTF